MASPGELTKVYDAMAESREPFQSFPATQWSLVERAQQGDDAGRRIALSSLLQRYWPALRAHLVLGKRLSTDRADDLLQGFVADKIIEQNLLDHAEKARGKFRTFILSTLNHYVISQHRMDTAAKRAPVEGISDLGDGAALLEGGHDPAEQFNVAWARDLISEALRRMEAECRQFQRPDLWTVFEGRVLGPAFEGREALDYTMLVVQLELKAPLEACRLLAAAKRMFARSLRTVVQEYAGATGDAEAELEDLQRALAHAGGQDDGATRNLSQVR